MRELMNLPEATATLNSSANNDAEGRVSPPASVTETTSVHPPHVAHTDETNNSVSHDGELRTRTLCSFCCKTRISDSLHSNQKTTMIENK